MSHTPEFACEVHATSSSADLRPEGDLDLATAPQVEAAICLLMGDGASVRLDLSRTRFIDSYTVRMLFSLHEYAERQAVDLLVYTGGNRTVQRVLEMCRVADLLQIDGDGAPDEDGVPLPLFVIDLEGVLEWWNGDAQALLGWTSEEALGRSLSELVAFPVGSWQHVLGHAVRRRRWSGTVGIRHKHGQPVPVRLALEAVQPAGFELLGFVCIVMPVSPHTHDPAPGTGT